MSDAIISAFCSYSHQDEPYKDLLLKHLSSLRRRGVIDVWHDRRLAAGDDIHGVIASELEQADIVLLLISPDFINSDYCFDRETRRALERHVAGECRVIPIIVRSCDWSDTPFAHLVAVPRDGVPVASWRDQDEAFTDVAKAIRKVAEDMRALKGHATAVSSHSQAVALTGSGAAESVLLSRAMGAVTQTKQPSRAFDGMDLSAAVPVRKTFSDMEKDQFMEDAYEVIASTFEASLKGLEQRQSGMSGTFRRVDAVHFTAAIYRNGNAVARCKIWHGGGHSTLGGICYSTNMSAGDNSMNESLSLEQSKEGLFLKPLGMAHLGGKWTDARLSPNDAAAYLWEVFTRPLSY